MSEAQPRTSLRALVAQQRGIHLPPDDVLHTVLPLFRAVAELHGRGRVADLGGGDIVQQADGVLALTAPDGREPTRATAAVERIQPAPSSALSIVGQVRVTVDSADGAAVETLDVRHDPDAPIDRPVYVPGFDAWELELGHHDAATDIFRLGQALACLALGLDFEDSDDLDLFAASRDDLFRIDPKLNPVLANIIVEMTALNRHERASDLASLVTRLETWRDQPVALDIGRVLARQAGARNRRAAVLSHLRDRLFDLSRRNRLIHFRPTQASVNLTEASVPLVLRLESIRPEQICTWGGDFAETVLAGKPIPLASRLRFEDQPFLPSALDRVIQETRRDRSEYGFSNLRLVVAFLRWRNLKEAPEERITSPLLWLPVELVKKKGVRDQYVLTCDGREAEFNPALRHYLRQLYDIRLPERVDLEATSIADIHADLCAQIQQSEPAVELRLVSKPEIKLIHQKAVQRLNQFQRRRGRTVAPIGGGRPDFSYDPDDYRPLGLALFRTRIQPSPLPLRGAVGAAPPPRAPHMAADGAAADGVTERTTFSRHEDQGHRYAWELDLTQVTLSNLNYRKMSLVRDYAELLDEAPESPAFDRIFSIEPKAIETESPPALPLAEQWDVVASDATQRAAIALARRKRSFIIQGPPGTGKSQTITNLIADHVARGQRVLFVCEKRAALDVVFHRLRQSGLDDLCCLIHDSQTDKKAFVQDLRETYKRWTGEADDLDRLDASRQALVGRLEEALGRIERFEASMAGAPEALAVALRTLIRRRLELPEPPPEIGRGARERLPDYAAFLKARPLLTQIFGAVRQTLGVDSLASHPFSRISAGLVAAPQPYAAIEAALREIEALTDRLDAEPEDGRLLNDGVSLTDAVLLTRAAREIATHDLAQRLDLLDPASGAAAALARERRELDGLTTDLAARREAVANWTDALSPEDARAALDLARRLEPSPFRWLSVDWWRLQAQLLRRYDRGRHALRPTWVRVLEALNRAHEAAAAKAEAEQRLAARYGATDLTAFVEAVDRLTEDLSAHPVLRALRQHLQTADDPSALARAVGALAPSAADLAAAAERAVFGWDDMTLGRIGEWARDLRESLEELPDFLPLLLALDRDHAAVAWTTRSVASTAPQLEALVAAESIARLLRRDPDLAQFDAAALADAVGAASRAERALAEQNARTIRAIRRRRFLDHAKLAARSTTQLDDAGRRFKKQYSAGRSQLEHEFGKSIRHRSVRELASGDTGVVINDLKPIWLMSPLSVSDTLPLAPDLFDVVIFDEASQIPTEEAVPALSRARQAVVVGDEMQLPPTRFFTAGVNDDETVEAEEDGERIAVNLDADSLLNQAARNLPATLLAWHYRSRSEALISFSNAAFYDGRLITVPDAVSNSGGDDLQAIRSDDPGAVARGVDALTARPISFHQVENGVYIDRRNRPEAAYIARLVRELLRREDGLSLGVVAFSEAQQSEIEAALEALADEDAAFATRLEREYVREDDGQFNGLFVKNLENVQGDERDIILLSICYAPGPDGRMAMNFGPINQRGGEKRLNVIFSRAKHHMAVVSTIDAGAITNTHNDGAAALKGFLQFAQTNSRGESERSQAVLASLNPSARRVFAAEPAGDPLRSALAEALRSRGRQVHERVGRSGFRCDLAVVDGAEPRRYALAILLDAPGATAEDARERYVFRPSILRSFGWRVLDLPSKDWLRDPERVLRRIEMALQGDEASDAETQEWEPPVVEAPAPPPAEPTPGRGVREFRSEQGGSSKFWRVGVEDCELTVAFGRIGAKGQTVVKVFDTPDRAVREMRKLIDEKVRKGYAEI